MRHSLFPIRLAVLFGAAMVFCAWTSLRADDSDPRLKVVDCVGQTSLFREDTEETSRLHIDQWVDDGERITTGPKSEVVLRLKNRAYLHLGEKSRLSISRLRFDETRGLLFRVTLLSGRLVAQLDQSPRYPFEIYVGDMLCQARGTLVEVVSQGKEVRVFSHQGSFVTSAKGRTDLVKKGQVISYEGGVYKDKYAFPTQDVVDLSEWREHLNNIRTGHFHIPPPTTAP
jgi:hypothetical protein